MAIDFPENTQLASRYVKQAIPLMIKNGVTPNPCNFALWYAYVANRDMELKRTLDDVVQEHNGVPDEISRDLFRQYVMKDEADLQRNLQESLTMVLQDMLGDVEKAQHGADDFERSLQAGLDTIEGDPENASLEDTIKRLIETTKSVKSVTNGFQNQLQSAESEINELRRQLVEKEQDVYTDQLTKIGNRRAFDRKMVELFQNSDSEMTLVLVDLDHFKKLNDTYGHLMGDKVLQGVGQVMQKVCPENALAARYGGEEFAFLLEDTQDAASVVAEAVRTTLTKLVLRKKDSGEAIDNITASFGVAQKVEGEFPEQLIERADQALYAAKEAGRNRVQIAA